MNYSCPMSFQTVDSNVSRFTSLIVASFIIAYLAIGDVMILYIVALDFIVRLFLNTKNSFFNIVAEKIKALFKLEDKYIDSGAKKLAAYFGLAFVSILVVFYHMDIWLATVIVAGIFLSCSLLDVFFNFCVGCKIYHIIKKLYPSFMS